MGTFVGWVMPAMRAFGGDAHAVAGVQLVGISGHFQLHRFSGMEKGGFFAFMALRMRIGAGMRRDYHHAKLDASLRIGR